MNQNCVIKGHVWLTNRTSSQNVKCYAPTVYKMQNNQQRKQDFKNAKSTIKYSQWQVFINLLTGGNYLCTLLIVINYLRQLIKT